VGQVAFLPTLVDKWLLRPFAALGSSRARLQRDEQYLDGVVKPLASMTPVNEAVTSALGLW